MRFLKSATMTLGFKFIAMSSGLAVSIIVGRTLGPEGRGIYGLIMTVIILASSLGVFGFNTANTYFVAQDKSRSRGFGLQSLFVGLTGAALATAVFLIIAALRPQTVSGLEGPLRWMTIAILPLFLWGQLFSQSYLGQGRIVGYNVFHAGQRVIFALAAIIILWWLGLDITTYMAVVLASVALLVAGYITTYFRTSPQGPLTGLKMTAKSFFYGCRPYTASIFTMATMRSGIFFVNYFKGTSEAGLFSVAQQISELLVIIPSVVGTILFSRVSSGNSRDLTARVIRTVASAFLPVFIVLALVAKPLIVLLYGEEFLGSVNALLIILPGSYLLGLEVIIAGDISGRGYPWGAALIWVWIFILNSIGYMVLIPAYGINGAAWSISICFALVFVYIVRYSRRLSGFTLAEMFIPRMADLREILSIPKMMMARSDQAQSNGDKNPPDQPGIFG